MVRGILEFLSRFSEKTSSEALESATTEPAALAVWSAACIGGSFLKFSPYTARDFHLV